MFISDDGSTTYFETEDYTYPLLMLCAFCSLNENAHHPVKIGGLNRGLVKDLEGGKVVMPSGNSFRLVPGFAIPCGWDWLPELAQFFGRDMSFQDSLGVPISMFAVTTRNGTSVCAACNVRMMHAASR